MTYEEALEKLNEIYNQYNNDCEEIKIAIDAIGLQIPKKPIIEDMNWCPTYCPTCGELLSEPYNDGYYEHRWWNTRCPNENCTQRLDWSDIHD